VPQLAYHPLFIATDFHIRRKLKNHVLFPSIIWAV
jgi:hypothetical protein